jgi:hypothetical protein
MHGGVTRVFTIVFAVAAATLLLAPNGGAREQAERVVDRTFACQAGYVGGLYQVDVTSMLSTDPSSKLRASSSVTQGLHQTLGHMTTDGVTVHRGLCAPSRARVALTTKGLRGGAVPPLGIESTCETPRRVLLRVRAVFTRPVTTQVSKQFGFPQFQAIGRIHQAAIGIGTPGGKTIAYTSVTGAEKARLFTLRTCKED